MSISAHSAVHIMS